MGAWVYSLRGEYFLFDPEYRNTLRIRIGKGEYKGTLIRKSPTHEKVLDIRQYTPHPEYHMAWMKYKDTQDYTMVLYDPSVVTGAFMENALTTKGDIGRVLMEQSSWVYCIGATLMEDDVLHFYRNPVCSYYWDLLEE